MGGGFEAFQRRAHRSSGESIQQTATLAAEIRSFRFCSPAADPEETTAVTLGFRSLARKFVWMTGRIEHAELAAALRGVNPDIDDCLQEAFDLRDALEPALVLIEELHAELANARTRRRRSYYSVRTGKNPLSKQIDLPALIKLFRTVYDYFDQEGYFQEQLGKDCVDAGFLPGEVGHDIEGAVFLALRKGHLCPIPAKLQDYTEEDLFDVIEDLFNLANNFGIRHHRQSQKTSYDPAIWYSWMFYYYLATIHAVVRLMEKHGIDEGGRDEGGAGRS